MATRQPITRICGCGQTCVFAVQAWSNLWDLISEPPSHYSMVMVMCASVFITEDKNNIVLLRKICNLMQKNINKYEHRCRLYYYVHAVSSLWLPCHCESHFLDILLLWFAILSFVTLNEVPQHFVGLLLLGRLCVSQEGMIVFCKTSFYNSFVGIWASASVNIHVNKMQ